MIDIRSNIQQIVEAPFDSLKKDGALTLLLLKTYAYLYLGKSAPNFCERCLKNYYNTIKMNGLERLKLIEEVEKRTCKPSFKGLQYFHGAHKHINPDWLTDAEALDYLNRGIMLPEHFEILPNGYNTEPIKPETNENNEGRAGRKGRNKAK